MPRHRSTDNQQKKQKVKIAEAEIIAVLQDAPQEGLSPSEVGILLGLGKEQRREVRDRLQELVRAGKVARRGRCYGLASGHEVEASRATGVIHVTPGGRGFVDLGEAYEEIKVDARDLGPAMDGDTVTVRAWDGRSRRMGMVLEVLERGRVRLVGNLCSDGGTGELYVKPDDPRLPPRIKVEDPGPARKGEAVLGDIVRYPERPGDVPVVKICRVLGEPGILITEVAKSVAGAGVEESIPAEVERACEGLPRAIDPREVQRRQDLRHLHFVTIDPMSARDFDDAVAVEQLEQQKTRVWVAVADVSHYVPEDSALDREARRRGCSLYLPDRAIHMLPEALSAGICSLVPRTDRLAMVVRLDISERGEVVQSDCCAAVIHSRGRLDYGGVAAALQGDFRGLRASYTEHAEVLETLHRVTAALRQARLRRGSLDLDLPESRVVLDEDDATRVRDIVQSRPDTPIKRAYGLIEELMVAANEAVGRIFEQARSETIWRVHPVPAPDALEQLCIYLASYGIDVEPRQIKSEKGMGKLLGRIQRHRAARPLSYLVLRTLKQAVYSVTNVGHFGLASKTYLHFTSPIRRYPDLHVHRLLKQLLAAQGQPAGTVHPVRQAAHRQLTAVARESSAAERRAVEVEREVRKLYAASLMRDRIGDQGWGTITGMASFGLFLALDQPAVEGLVPLRSLARDAELDPQRLRLLVQSESRIYSLGDQLQVRVTDASVARRQVTLSTVTEGEWHKADPDVAFSELYAPPSWWEQKRSGGKSKRRGVRGSQGGKRDDRRGGQRGGRGRGRGGQHKRR